MKFTWIVIFLIPLNLLGQHFSKEGRFSIAYERGCAPTTVHITQYQHLEKPRSFLFLEDGDFVGDTSFTYTDPGIYHIVQLIGEDISPKTDTLTFTVLNPEQPTFEIYSCNSNGVEVNILDTYYDLYRIYFSPTDSIDISSEDPNPQFSYSDPNITMSVKGLFTDSYTASCGMTTKSIQIEASSYTATVDSAYFSMNCDNTFSLTLQTSNTSNFKYEIIISDDQQTQTIYSGGLSSALNIPDLLITEESEKCISINTLDPCDGSATSNTPYCLTPNLIRLGNFYGAYASHVNGGIFLDFGNSDNEEVKIVRQDANNKETRLPNQISASTIDPTSSTRVFTYDISFAGTNCDTLENTAEIRAPYISLVSKSLDNRISLNITPPLNKLDSSAIEMFVLFYSLDSAQTIRTPYDGSFALQPSIGRLQNIRLGYSYLNDDITIYSNEIRTRINYIVHVPKAFTPDNGDNLNNELLFFGLPTNEGFLHIYNRWGEVIYESADISVGWNGRSKEGKAPQGTYRYKLSFKTPEGELKSQVGTFVLIRE
ncbi:MAG: gliding motility-associated C-terminal domain-containing protein [Cyclobacteriaceae bacterium]